MKPPAAGRTGVNPRPGRWQARGVQTPLNHFCSLTIQDLSKFRQFRRRDELPHAEGQKGVRAEAIAPRWGLGSSLTAARPAQGPAWARGSRAATGHAGSARSCDSSPQTRGPGQNVMAAQCRGHSQGATGHAPSGTCWEGPSRPPAFWGWRPVVPDIPRLAAAVLPPRPRRPRAASPAAPALLRGQRAGWIQGRPPPAQPHFNDQLQ